MTQLNLSIDRNNLEEEWITQPEAYYHWAKRAADAQLEYDRSKANLDVVRAEVDRAVRDGPMSFGIGKLTETAVSNAVLSTTAYKEAYEELNLAKHALQIAQAAVNALEHKKRALTMLVELWIRSYYADPQAKSEVPEEWGKKRIRQS
jgi:hypothetical protein